VGAGVDAAETDADAVPLKRGLEASNAETNPLEAMIAATTIASASVLTNRGVFTMGLTQSDLSGRVSYDRIVIVILCEYANRHASKNGV
jgi:hypothetical protein